ncbi:hypothetical protein [Lysobacter sp. D1-1-M9]|uniref:hypothetical protein n=1 Tax=Novilysobacter longmucuonensis TaxID=3098603 RepID=UPI003983749F
MNDTPATTASTDNGVGIPQAARAHLFQSFQQAEVSPASTSTCRSRISRARRPCRSGFSRELFDPAGENFRLRAAMYSFAAEAAPTKSAEPP